MLVLGCGKLRRILATVCKLYSGDDMEVLENDGDWHFITLGDQV